MKNPDPNPEDEAFEELALKQGHWQYASGWRKKQIIKTSMRQDEIIEMARQAGFNHGLDDPIIYAAHERFAKLVAEKEREACAKVVEPTEEHRREFQHYIGGKEGVEMLDSLAAHIRARGQA